MANTVLLNDKVYHYPLTTVSGAAIPSGSAVQAVSSSPTSLNASLSGTNLTLTPMVQASTGITVTLTGNGIGSAVMVFDIVPDPSLLVLQFGTPTTTSQSPPAAPGP